MLSAFYKDRTLLRTYANTIQPATLIPGRVSYVELDLSILVEPDMSCEVLTQAEFEQASEQLRYSEETRIGALMALDTLTSSVQRSIGLFTIVPHQLSRVDFHLAHCS
jgi:protein associated with RNAse G/E